MGKQPQQRKCLALNNKSNAAKRRPQQLPPLATSSASSTDSPPYPPSLSTIVLDNADLVGLVASFLRFGRKPHTVKKKDSATFSCLAESPDLHDSSLDNSLPRFARCCRRAHSLLMRDGPWWQQQCLCLDLHEPLIPRQEWNWSRRSFNTRKAAVPVDGFGPRQQQIVRRLLGDEVYEREVAPKLSEVLNVTWIRQT